MLQANGLARWYGDFRAVDEFFSIGRGGRGSVGTQWRR